MFWLTLQNCSKLLHVYAGLYCNVNENQCGCEPLNLEKGRFGALEPAVPNYITEFSPTNSRPNAYVAQCDGCLLTEREVASLMLGVDDLFFFFLFSLFLFFFFPVKNHLPKGSVCLPFLVLKNRREP